MKIALDWIAEYLDRPLDPAPAADALINAGLPVDSITPHLGTTILDVEVTSNRSDCFSHVGLARELATLLGLTFRPPTAAVRDNGPSITPLVSVQVDDPAACPYYSARLIQNVKVASSPEWLQHRLLSIGLRPINNVVDITNYILMELGQPLHAFDFSTLAGSKIIVRRAREKETLLAINGQTYTLQPHHLVIADANTPVALAGVMGGKLSEVTERTTSILLESARFDPLTIRTAARNLTLMSDSSFRFERGIDPAAADAASKRAAQLIAELTGGTVAQGVITVGAARTTGPTVDLRPERISRILGITIPLPRVIAILTSLGFAPTLVDGLIRCQIPTHRLDIDREIDLIEEVARVHGYEQIPVQSHVTHKVTPRPIAERAAAVARSALLSAGYSEAITVTFVDDAEAKMFIPPAATPIRVSDSVRGSSNTLRTSLLNGLLNVRRINQNAGNPAANIFEQTSVFLALPDPAEPPLEARKLAFLGDSVPNVRGALEILFQRINPEYKITINPKDIPGFAPGAAGTIAINLDDGERTSIGILGHIGLIAPQIQKHYDLRLPVAAMEIDWDGLLSGFQPVRRAKPLPRYQSVKRDLSLVLAEAIRYSDVEQSILNSSPQFLESIHHVVTFRGKQLEAGKKSLTLSLEFRDPATTLRAEQVDTQIKSITDLLATKFSATLRA